MAIMRTIPRERGPTQSHAPQSSRLQAVLCPIPDLSRRRRARDVDKTPELRLGLACTRRTMLPEVGCANRLPGSPNTPAHQPCLITRYIKTHQPSVPAPASGQATRGARPPTQAESSGEANDTGKRH
eukprot:2027845-Rhodomonas_salina.2